MYSNYERIDMILKLGVSKRTDTKEGTQFRVIMEHEEILIFCFWPFVKPQELLEVITTLLNYQNSFWYKIGVMLLKRPSVLFDTPDMMSQFLK
jgi:hypothetical protein